VRAAGTVLDEEQDVQATLEHGLDVEVGQVPGPATDH
jgi:hypothetical protein